jgi:amino acid adenylation domain-containing protein
MGLHHYTLAAAAGSGERTAIVEGTGRSVSFSELARISEMLRDRLTALGIRRGDRVGVYLHKSADSVAAMLGALRAGAGYVPVDPGAPARRNAFIFANSGAKVVIVEARFAAALRSELAGADAQPELIVLDGVGGGEPLKTRLKAINAANPAPSTTDAKVDGDDLAYILYTSGSTGRPKGVALTHRSACSFVDWCSETFEPTACDRFSAHAPFHFDLSIFDIWVSLKHGATLVIIDEHLGKDPAGLAGFIAEQRISIWYSAPSILSLLAQRGNLLDHDYRNLRMVLFAGEVFPVTHLRALKRLWPRPEYYNLYGPTETNVCTFHPIPSIVPDDRSEPYPIGKVCAHLRAMVVDDNGRCLPDDAEGELCIAGPGVMAGYWALPEMTERSFLTDSDGTRWYQTGDIVAHDQRGDFKFLGRRDRMVKKRGYRIELGEIESCLHNHDEVREAAVVAIADEDAGLRVQAHLGTENGKRLSLINLKQFCSEHLPVYMVPDSFVFHDTLPKTSTGKIDYQALKTEGTGTWERRTEVAAGAGGNG